MQINGGFWVYAGILEHLQHFSPGRHPASRISLRRHVGRFAAGLLLPCFRGVCPFGRVDRAMNEHAVGQSPRTPVQRSDEVRLLLLHATAASSTATITTPVAGIFRVVVIRRPSLLGRHLDGRG